MSDGPIMRPGTLTVLYGDEIVTLDPLSDFAKYHDDRLRVNTLLMKIDVAAAARRVKSADPKDRSVA